MTATAVFGEFSAHCAYTLEQIAQRCGREREWAYYAFIRPSNQKTKKRLLDEEGEPIPPVKHAKIGSVYMVTGQALIAWIAEWGERLGETG